MGLKIFRSTASKVPGIRGYKIICYLHPAIVIAKLWEIVHRLLKFLLYFKSKAPVSQLVNADDT